MQRLQGLLSIRALITLALVAALVIIVRGHPQNRLADPAQRPWPPEVCLRLLHADDPLLRSYALDDLLTQGPDVVPWLRQAALGDDPALAQTALEVLVESLMINSPELVGATIDTLQELAELRLGRMSALASRHLKQQQSRILEICLRELLHSGARISNLQMLASEVDQGAHTTVLLGPDWSGGDAGLQWIRRLPIRAIVYLVAGDEASSSAFDELRTARPDIFVQRKGPCCLGIVFGNQLVVDGVLPGSPAEAAGIYVTERIERVDGVRVNQLQNLIELLADRIPGEVVRITLLGPGLINRRDVSLVLGTDVNTGRCQCVEPLTTNSEGTGTE